MVLNIVAGILIIIFVILFFLSLDDIINSEW